MVNQRDNLVPEHPQRAAAASRVLLFRTLTLLWVFPSLGALVVLLHDTAWSRAEGALARLALVSIEQWVAVGLLLLHAWFAWRWKHWARTT